MKIVVLVSDRLFHSAEQLASRLGVSRSELYSKVLAALVDEHRDDVITFRLNEIYGCARNSSSLEAGIALLQHRTLARSKR